MKKYLFCITLFLSLFLIFLTTYSYSKNKDYNNSVVVLKKGGAISGNFFVNNNDIVLDNYNLKIKSEDVDDIFPYKKEFLDVAFNRNSCIFFKYGPEIPNKDIELMLKVAMTSPSGYDLRTCHFIVVKDRQKIQSLIKPIANEDGVGKGRIDANLLFVLCGKIKEIKQNGCTDFLVNSLMLWLAAEYLGYAVAFVDIVTPDGDKMRENLFRKELLIPNDVLPFNMILVGYYNGEKISKNKFNETKIHNGFWTNK